MNKQKQETKDNLVNFDNFCKYVKENTIVSNITVGSFNMAKTGVEIGIFGKVLFEDNQVELPVVIFFTDNETVNKDHSFDRVERAIKTYTRIKELQEIISKNLPKEFEVKNTSSQSFGFQGFSFSDPDKKNRYYVKIDSFTLLNIVSIKEVNGRTITTSVESDELYHENLEDFEKTFVEMFNAIK